MKPTPSARTGLKAAVVSAGAVLLLSSGVEFAATGHVPWQAPATPAGAQTSASSDQPTDVGTTTTGPATQAFRGLCRAYLYGNKALRGQALQSPAFDALATAAGGLDQVTTYCVTIAGPGATHPTHPAHPSHPAHPAGGP